MDSTRLLVEFDKSGAEWVCVAYLSGDANMLSVVESGKSPHLVTGSLISGAPEEFVQEEHELVGMASDPSRIEELREPITQKVDDAWFLPRSSSIYQMAKRSNYGLNYDMKYRRFALECEIPDKEAEVIVDHYKRRAYPGIPIWHRAIQTELRSDRTLTNCFGRKRHFMDSWGADLFDAAYAFKPQSTVWDIIREGMIKIYNDETPDFEKVEMLEEVHDSILTQMFIDNYEKAAEVFLKIGLDYMSPICEYNSREFQIKTTVKIGKDWGNMHECTLSEDTSVTAKSIQEIVETIQNDQETAQQLA